MKILPTILAWGLVVAAICAVIFVYIFGFAAFYNPNGGKSHLREFFGLYSVCVFLIALFVAFLLTSKREAWSTGVRFGVLAAFVAATYGGFASYVAMNPAATHYKRTMLGLDYAVPRQNASNADAEIADVAFLYTPICLAKQSPYRGPECVPVEGVGSYSSAKLSMGPITDGFWVKDVLTDLEITYEGDVLGAVPDSVSSVVDGITMIVNANQRLMVDLDPERRIMRAVWCRTNYAQCTAFVQTKYGVLQFPTIGPAEVDKVRWAKDQAVYEAVFGAWRCAEATCGGLFLGGAIVAYE